MPAFPSIPADAPPYVNAPQLGRWLHVHPRTVLRWAQEGVLPQPIRLTARTLWFEVNAVRAALARRFNPPGPSPPGANPVAEAELPAPPNG